MKNIIKVSAIIALLGLVFIGCRSMAVYNVNNSPIMAKVSKDKIFTAIKKAGYSKGWVITKIEEGLAEGKINLRTHEAIILIPYTSKSFSIKYKNSINLKYDKEKGTIHKNYNGWIQNLEKAINFELEYIK